MKLKIVLVFSCLFMLLGVASCKQADEYDAYVHSSTRDGIQAIRISKISPLRYPTLRITKKSSIKSVLKHLDFSNLDFKNKMEITEYDEYFPIVIDSMRIVFYGIAEELYTIVIHNDGTIYKVSWTSIFSESMCIEYTDKGCIQPEVFMEYLDSEFWHGIEPIDPGSSQSHPNYPWEIIVK